MLLHPANLLTMTSRPWRLCPDLDAYPDEQCKAFLDRAVGSRHAGLLAACACALVLGIASFVGTTTTIEHFAGRNSVWLDGETWQGRISITVQATTMFLLVGAIAPVPYIKLLRRGVNEVLHRAKCPSCTYSLQGLIVENDRVRCPECGTVIALGALGLTRDSIALGRPVPDGAPEGTIDTNSKQRSKTWAGIGACSLAAWLVVGWQLLLIATLGLFMMATFGQSMRQYAAEQMKPTGPN